jgi:hypothetical protein
MRNKPTIISLKTPSYEYGQEPALLPNNRQQNYGDNADRLAEEGRTNFDTSEVFDNEANETHPIMGTTITTQGSHAVGRPLEVRLHKTSIISNSLSLFTHKPRSKSRFLTLILFWLVLYFFLSRTSDGMELTSISFPLGNEVAKRKKIFAFTHSFASLA